MANILVVEDDVNLAAGLEYNLVRAGHAVTRAADGPAGLASVVAHAPDLVILDLMLPGMDGFEVLRRLRDRESTVPVVILSARGEESAKVRGFEEGAVDYVTKPFGMAELLARVRARLSPHAGAVERFPLGDRLVDLVDHTVMRDGASIALTPMEVEVLRRLRRRLGHPVARTELLRAIWGVTPSASRTLDAHVNRLRKKIEDDPANPRHLVTVHSVGYRLVP